MTTATAAIDTSQKPSRGLHIGLWVAQALLALAFGMAGGMKLFTPIAELTKQSPGLSGSLIRFIGASEFLGAIGLILPAATRIKPGLTSLAGAALAVVMVLAAGFHIMQGDFKGIAAPVIIGALCVFVAWGRYKMAPIQPRS